MPTEGAPPRAKNDPHLQQVLLPPENLAPMVRLDVAAMIATTSTSSLLKRIQRANKSDEVFNRIREQMVSGATGAIEGWHLKWCTLQEDVLYYRSQLAMPMQMATEVLHLIHAGKETGHPGVAKTLDLVKRLGIAFA